MSFADDLLMQADQLIAQDPRRPKQASLRRGVSAAYYALFHLLTEASANFLISGNGPGREELRNAIRRGYGHNEMKAISNGFAGGTPPQPWKAASGVISPHLRLVAETFVELQEARHQADYDHARSWTRQEAVDLVRRAQLAFVEWERAKGARDAYAYLAAMVIKSRA